MEPSDALKTITVLLRASQSLQELVKQEMASYGLNATEFAVLEFLYHKGDQPIQVIGKKILLSSGSMTYVVDRLEEKGYLIRKDCPNDRRITYAALTDDGERLMQDIFPKHTEHMNAVFEGMQLNETIEQLKQIGKRAEAAKNFNHVS